MSTPNSPYQPQPDPTQGQPYQHYPEPQSAQPPVVEPTDQSSYSNTVQQSYEADPGQAADTGQSIQPYQSQVQPSPSQGQPYATGPQTYQSQGQPYPSQGQAYGAAPAGQQAAPAEQADSRAILAAQMAYDNEKKTPLTMWLLWFFLGGLGGHRFYLGDTGYALAMLFLNWLTLGIWALVDAFLISGRLAAVNREKQREIFSRYRLLPPS